MTVRPCGNHPQASRSKPSSPTPLSGAVAAAFALLAPPASAIVISVDGQEPLGSLGTGFGSSYYGVGHVLNPRGGNCTGTPISRTVVLSAAHCFDGDDAGGAPDAPTATFSLGRADGSVLRAVGTVTSHPDYTGWFSRHDLALITFATPLPVDVPVFRLGDFDAVPVGAIVGHAGYGRTGTGASGATGNLSFPQLNVTYNVIDRAVEGGTMFETDFDGGGAPNRMGSATPLSRGASKDGPIRFEGTTAPGDSGGPAFYNPSVSLRFIDLPAGVFVKLVPDLNYVIGVTSYGRDENRNDVRSDYGDVGGYTFLDQAHRDWILGLAPDAQALQAEYPWDVLPSADYSPIAAPEIEPPLTPRAVPAPGSLALALAGIGVLGALRRVAGVRGERRRPRD